MLTIQALQDLGVNTKEGLTRCVNNESFYFRMIKKAMDDNSYEQLRDAIAANQLDEAFEIAHKLKGATGNLSLTPLYDPICTISDGLKAHEEKDYTPYVTAMMSAREAITALCAD